VVRNALWSESIAVGNPAFVDKVKIELGFKAVHRQVTEVTGRYTLWEQSEAYAENLGSESEPLTIEKIIFRDENAETAKT
jgi:hypothetical protein